MNPTFQFEAEVWLWSSEKAAWHFVTIPEKSTKEIKGYTTPRRGFGSIPIIASIGQSTWKTSIFPHKKKYYLLPIKSEIRKTEKIKIGSKLKVTISLQ